tara:strand:+ start:1191 stop:1421 length:231 start_codon:yes stop_codon:yes gene_type:complete
LKTPFFPQSEIKQGVSLNATYLQTVTEAAHGVGRIVEINSAAKADAAAYVSSIDPTFVQPPEGAGPKEFSGRIGEE